jgi:DNA-binding transcriptional regulator YiaG
MMCAIKLRVSESTIWNWRKGKTDPSAENALLLRNFCAEHRYLITNAL